jgi:hypothetical protein
VKAISVLRTVPNRIGRRAFEAQHEPLVGGPSLSAVPQKLRELKNGEVLGGQHAAAGH